MKIRQGFVSNSSSSSFVVQPAKPVELQKHEHLSDEYFFDASKGNLEFGRQNEVYKDYWSKINFLIMVAHGYSMDRSDKLKNFEWDIEYGTLPKDTDIEDLCDLDCLGNVIEALRQITGAHVIKTNLVDYYDEKPFFSKLDTVKPYCEGYVDHGSHWSESPRTLLLLKDINKIKQFIMSPYAAVVNFSDESDSEDAERLFEPFYNNDHYDQSEIKKMWSDFVYEKSND